MILKQYSIKYINNFIIMLSQRNIFKWIQQPTITSDKCFIILFSLTGALAMKHVYNIQRQKCHIYILPCLPHPKHLHFTIPWNEGTDTQAPNLIPLKVTAAPCRKSPSPQYHHYQRTQKKVHYLQMTLKKEYII